MNFCPECENYLALKIRSDDASGRQLMHHFCRNCGYTADVKASKDKQYIYKSDYDIQKLFMLDKNIQYLCDDPTLPRVNNIPCPNSNCPSKKNTEGDGLAKDDGDVVYYNINEKNMKYVYLCCQCKHTWTNA
jgi:DNA-directed RNA polymerase subunit M/transcription elongation factor TFIIS